MDRDKDGLQYSPICDGELYTYSVCEDGTVIKCSQKLGRESTAKPYLKSGQATVKIGLFQ